MQTSMFAQPSIKTPLRYAGAKSRAVELLCGFVPSDVREVVSPFIGGGSVELGLTGRGVRVFGYDAFPPVVTCWEALLGHPEALCGRVRELLREHDKTTLEAVQRAGLDESLPALDRAALFLILCGIGWNGRALRSVGVSPFFLDSEGLPRLQHPTKKRVLIHLSRIESFQNPLLSVEQADFRESLARHPDMFAYCDPPYPTPYYGVYGDSAVYHEKFPHEALAGILRQRQRWMLSYNDHELVRELYPESEFHWDRLVWNHTSRAKGRSEGDDVLIRPLPLPPQ